MINQNSTRIHVSIHGHQHRTTPRITHESAKTFSEEGITRTRGQHPALGGLVNRLSSGRSISIAMRWWPEHVVSAARLADMQAVDARGNATHGRKGHRSSS